MRFGEAVAEPGTENAIFEFQDLFVYINSTLSKRHDTGHLILFHLGGFGERSNTGKLSGYLVG
jgi:hypothetical protein